ncbi:cytochrome P450 [Streptomyces yaizuensis]|uniref:Cytochrome P450 n=1 Tax=Streptomyces yaizuensis TaxID=2989713 RepID=A0ABQ5NTM6_9ACTN|nr:cytochrome P450 [Streptomyces sp. YSPA8]GLF93366.1 cytochrome P450 [Streptomyces sp. YSPA8]
MTHSQELPLFPFTGPADRPRDREGERLRETAPVVRARLADGTPVWVALSHSATRQVLTTPVFSRGAAMLPGAPVLGEGMALPSMISSMEGPEHSRIRRLITRAFSPRMVDTMTPWITELVVELLDGLAAGPQPADLVAGLTEPLPIRVICRLLGVPRADAGRFSAWTGLLATAGSPDGVEAAFGALRAYIDRLVGEKRRSPGDDLTSELTLLADETGAVDQEQLVNNLVLLLGAGYETTVEQLGHSLFALLAEREHYARLCREPELVGNAVEELLRHALLMPTGTLVRVATEDIELGGRPVRAGDGVVALPHVANHDPEAFADDPGTLDLARADASRHLSFGAGAHFCVGAQLARAEMRITVAELVRRHPGAVLAVDPGAVEWKTGALTRGPVRLPVALA